MFIRKALVEITNEVRNELPHSHTHQLNSWASGSPVTDGESIYAYFGYHGLYCLNMNGKVLWKCSGLTRNVIPLPVYSEGMLYLMSGFRGNALLAIDLSKARGNITGTEAIAWKYEQNTPYTLSGPDGRETLFSQGKQWIFNMLGCHTK